MTTEEGVPQASQPAEDLDAEPTDALENIGRRGFIERASSIAMFGGLTAAYGTLGAVALRYIYPARPRLAAWMYAAKADSMVSGASARFVSPIGERIAIARTGDTGAVSDFVALSSTCPHLGCQVHWEATPRRFFCPCHNGTFDALGKATGGPPFKAGQSLPRYPVKVERGLLYIEVALEGLPREPGS